jgi:hypothetical protein
MTMRAPWSHKEQRPVHANEPHVFLPVHDAGLGTGLAGLGSRDSGFPAQIAITDRYLRTSACAVPGCGKDRDDPIHEPAE